jgi:hypothetical protein
VTYLLFVGVLIYGVPPTILGAVVAAALNYQVRTINYIHRRFSCEVEAIPKEKSNKQRTPDRVSNNHWNQVLPYPCTISLS